MGTLKRLAAGPETAYMRARLPVWNESDRRDRRIRWLVVGGALIATQFLGLIVSVVAGFFEPWLFAMLAAPALGVALGVFGFHVIRSVAQVLVRNRSDRPSQKLARRRRPRDASGSRPLFMETMKPENRDRLVIAFLVVGAAVSFVGLNWLGANSLFKRPGLGFVQPGLFVLSLVAVHFMVKAADRRRVWMRTRRKSRDN